MLTKIRKVSVFVNATLIREDDVGTGNCLRGGHYSRGCKRDAIYSPVQVVIETAKGVIVSDQPQLGATVSRGAV